MSKLNLLVPFIFVVYLFAVGIIRGIEDNEFIKPNFIIESEEGIFERQRVDNEFCRVSTFKPGTIKTEYGLLRGRRHNLFDRLLCPVIQYLGVPYAMPPVNERRWRKPERPAPWRGVKDALKMGAVCPQKFNGPFPHALLPVWFQRAKNSTMELYENMSEDCLYLNIYVPMESYFNETTSSTNKKKNLPVMVFIHGHTFMEGSGNFYDGSVLASYGKLIVITINYRLGVFGFLSTSNGNSLGNYGLWDQIKALEWISKNIGHFGGDKDRITLFGSGSGASSISLLTVSVQAGNLFEKVILQSGTALSSWSIVRRPSEQFNKLKKHQGIDCDNMSDEESMKCLRKRDWRKLVEVDVRSRQYNLAFGPVVDGTDGILSDEPKLLMDRGEFLNYPMILGVTQGDGCSFILQQAPEKVLKKINKDSARKEYTQRDFHMDIDDFVDGFYGQVGKGTTILRRVIEFMYTDWTNENNSTSLRRSLLNLYTDKQWVEPVTRTAQLHIDQGNVVYFYTFNHRPVSAESLDWIDAGHGDELPYIFGYPFTSKKDVLFGYNYSRVDRMVSAGVMTYWTNFAKTGNPMKGSEQLTRFITGTPNKFEEVTWPKYDSMRRRHLEISKKPKVGDHYRADEVAFWNKFLPNLVKDSDRLMPPPGRITSARPPFASTENKETNAAEKTSKWTPKPDTLTSLTHALDRGRPKSEGGMSLQLSITLAIGFVLLFVNIIAFSVVSYHKEKDKFKIEKLEAQLEEKRRRFSDDMKRHYSSVSNGKNQGNKYEFGTKHVEVGASRPPLSRPSYAVNTARSYAHFPSNNLSVRASSTTALPQLKPCVFRDDSLTSTSAEESFRQSQRRNFAKLHNICHSSDEGSPGSMLVCNSKEELALLYPPIAESEMERTKGNLSIDSGGRYSLQTTGSTSPDHRSYRISHRSVRGKPVSQRPLSLRVVHGAGEESNRPTSLWSVVSSVAGKSSYKQLRTSDAGRNVDLESISGPSNASAVDPREYQNTNERNKSTYKIPPCILRDVSCGSKSALLSSPLDKFNPRSETSGSETDHTGSPSHFENAHSQSMSNKEEKSVVTKL